jgi:hypothetical protein
MDVRACGDGRQSERAQNGWDFASIIELVRYEIRDWRNNHTAIRRRILTRLWLVKIFRNVVLVPPRVSPLHGVIAESDRPKKRLENLEPMAVPVNVRACRLALVFRPASESLWG